MPSAYVNDPALPARDLLQIEPDERTSRDLDAGALTRVSRRLYISTNLVDHRPLYSGMAFDGHTSLSVLSSPTPLSPKPPMTVFADVPLLLLQAYLHGEGSISLGSRTWRVQASRPVLMHAPAGSVIRLSGGASGSRACITAISDARRLLESFGLQEQDLASEQRELVLGGGTGGTVIMDTPPRDAFGLIRDLAYARADGEWHVVQSWGRLVQVFADALRACKRHEDLALNAKPIGHRDFEIARRARDALSDRYADAPRAQALARQLGTNATTLRKAFRAAHGCTMEEFINDCRITEAQRLLADTTLAICEVALKVGYVHQSSLSSSFRDATGLTPREYRRRTQRPGARRVS